MTYLLLFDVDGTLLLSHDQVYVDALLPAIHETYGLELAESDLVDIPGATVTAALRVVLRGHGLADGEIDGRVAAFCRAFEELYVRMLGAAATDTWITPPHLDRVLAALAQEHRLALVTGNPRRVAQTRMRRLGLERFFPEDQGAFGCERETRAELIALARERAGAWPAERTAIVGDTPLDVAGGREAGVHTIGVATGRYSAGELRDAGADDVVDALDGLGAIL